MDAPTEVHAAAERFDDVAVVIGPRRPDVGGCWCTAYRDSRVGTAERPAYLSAL